LIAAAKSIEEVKGWDKIEKRPRGAALGAKGLWTGAVHDLIRGEGGGWKYDQSSLFGSLRGKKQGRCSCK